MCTWASLCWSVQRSVQHQGFGCRLVVCSWVSFGLFKAQFSKAVAKWMAKRTSYCRRRAGHATGGVGATPQFREGPGVAKCDLSYFSYFVLLRRCPFWAQLPKRAHTQLHNNGRGWGGRGGAGARAHGRDFSEEAFFGEPTSWVGGRWRSSNGAGCLRGTKRAGWGRAFPRRWRASALIGEERVGSACG